MRFLLLSLLCITLVNAAEIEVKSNPSECDVYIVDKNGKKNSVGKTPYKADLNTLKANYGADGPLQVEIFKPGFEAYSVSVPVLKKANVEINANLKVEKDIRLSQDFDFLVADLFDVLRLMRNKNFDTALAKLSKLETKFPHFSVIQEMKGSISYMNKDFKKSLSHYRKAFGINPKNREAYKMKKYLEKKFNIASSKGSR